MTAFERAALKSLAAGLATNVALNAVLIPAAGLTGAAAATAVSVGFYHLALCRAAYRLTGIHAHCLARQNPGTMTR
jgi:O-antigen/teichoic acid export membrane protein